MYMEVMVIPMNIQITAKILPRNLVGVLSPYPTVVIEMKLHQKPSNKPEMKERGNWSLLCHVSHNHMTKPEEMKKSRRVAKEPV